MTELEKQTQVFNVTFKEKAVDTQLWENISGDVVSIEALGHYSLFRKIRDEVDTICAVEDIAVKASWIVGDITRFHEAVPHGWGMEF